MTIAALIIVGVLLIGSTLIASVLVQRRAERALRRVQPDGGRRLGEDDEYEDRLRRGLRARMSHELRTPLNSIITLSQLLIEDKTAALTAEQRRYLEVIRRNGRNLLALVDQIAEAGPPEASPAGPAALAPPAEEPQLPPPSPFDGPHEPGPVLLIED